MKRLEFSIWFIACPILLLLPGLPWAAETTGKSAAAPAAKQPLVVFLVRHAEKVDKSADARLSQAGKKRAQKLAHVLRDAKLQHVHSSDFIRTRDTAEPIAAQGGLKVKLYDRRDLPSFIRKLRETGGRHLVVGHSTTTPVAVKLLGGEAGAVINEPSEFDRLYILTIDENGKTTTVMTRYGEPSKLH